MIKAREVTVRAPARGGMPGRLPGRALLDGVSVTLPPGTLTAVLGPNGAGKTTLLRVLAGESRPDAGEVLLDGSPVAALGRAALARRRAVLGQHQALEFGLLVADVVALGRLPHAGTGAARHDRTAVAAVRGLFGLAPFWRRAYPSLSGGERQRVQLARVAAQLWQPASLRAASGAAPTRALFLDEPTAALDLAQQSLAIGYARQEADAGAAVLAVLHDLNQAAAADRVVLLREGKVVGAGPTRDILRPPLLEACFGVPVEEVIRRDGTTGLLPAAYASARSGREPNLAGRCVAL